MKPSTKTSDSPWFSPEPFSCWPAVGPNCFRINPAGFFDPIVFVDPSTLQEFIENSRITVGGIMFCQVDMSWSHESHFKFLSLRQCKIFLVCLFHHLGPNDGPLNPPKKTNLHLPKCLALPNVAATRTYSSPLLWGIEPSPFLIWIPCFFFRCFVFYPSLRRGKKT